MMVVEVEKLKQVECMANGRSDAVDPFHTLPLQLAAGTELLLLL